MNCDAMTRGGRLGSPLLALLLVCPLIGCDPTPIAVRCNSTVDCALDEQCDDGICVVDNRPPPPPPPRPDAGVVDAGEIDGGSDAGPFVPSDGGPSDGGVTDGGSDAGPVLPPGWFHPNWTARRQVTFETPEAVDETLIDVPVQVVLTSADVPGARDDVGDVRFVDGDGALLAYELEGFKDGDASFWVKVPVLAPAGEVSSTVYAYWGNPTAEPLPYRPAVWSNDFVGVWHLDNTLQNYADTQLRKTTSLNRGASYDDGFQGGLDLDGSNDSATVATETALTLGASVITLDGRFLTSSTAPELQVILGVSIAATSPDDRSRASVALAEGGGFEVYGRNNDADTYVSHRSPLDLYGPDEWHHVAGTLDFVNGTVDIYLDGENVYHGTQTFRETPATTPVQRIVIGAEDDTVGNHFEGRIDEPRISLVARSASWHRVQAALVQGPIHVFGDIETIAASATGSLPTLEADTISILEDAPEDTYAPLDNDVDSDGDPLFITAVGESTLGTLTLLPDARTLTFVPRSNAFGAEEIAVTIADGNNGTLTSPLLIAVESVNDVPVARDDRTAIRGGETAPVEILDNDADVESGANVTISILGTPDSIVAQVIEQRIFVTTSDPTPRNHTLRYRIEDEDGEHADANLYISVHNAPNGWSFEDKSATANIPRGASPWGISVVDIDADGELDVAALSRSSSVVHLGGGGFSFEPYWTGPEMRSLGFADVDNVAGLEAFSPLTRRFYKSAPSGLETVGAALVGNLASAVWVDYDDDDYMDLFLPNEDAPYSGFLHNDGGTGWTADIDPFSSSSLDIESVTATDINGDGVLDYLAAGTRLHFFVSQPDGTFARETAERGLGAELFPSSFVGAAFGDCDNDGDFDLFLGGNGSNAPLLFRNTDGVFAKDGNFDFPTRSPMGVALGDLDNNGTLDAFFGGGGNLDGGAALTHGSLLLMNLGDCRFVDVAPALGMQQMNNPITGTVLADLDRDGDLDIVSNRHASTVGVFENTLPASMSLRVVVREIRGAATPPRVPFGAVVELVTLSGKTMVRQISGGEGFFSQGPPDAHFGLGGEFGPVEVRITYPNGETIGRIVDPLEANDDGPFSVIIDGT